MLLNAPENSGALHALKGTRNRDFDYRERAFAKAGRNLESEGHVSI